MALGLLLILVAAVRSVGFPNLDEHSAARGSPTSCSSRAPARSRSSWPRKGSPSARG